MLLLRMNIKAGLKHQSYWTWSVTDCQFSSFSRGQKQFSFGVSLSLSLYERGLNISITVLENMLRSLQNDSSGSCKCSSRWHRHHVWGQKEVQLHMRHTLNHNTKKQEWAGQPVCLNWCWLWETLHPNASTKNLGKKWLFFFFCFYHSMGLRLGWTARVRFIQVFLVREKIKQTSLFGHISFSVKKVTKEKDTLTVMHFLCMCFNSLICMSIRDWGQVDSFDPAVF